MSVLAILAVFHFLHAGILPPVLLHPLGLCTGTPHQILLCHSYNLYSGIGSDLSELTLLGFFMALLKHLNCDAPRCFRYGPHRTADGHHKLCRVHHPDLPNHKLSLHEITHRHNKAEQERVKTTDV